MKKSVLWGISAVMLAAMLSAAGAVEKATPGRLAGVLDVYTQNRADGIANFVTADLLMVGYSLIRQRVLGEAETHVYAPLLRQIVVGLKSALRKESADEVTQANRDYLAVLEALLAGSAQVAGAGNPQRAQAELGAVLAAEGIRLSPLWQRPVDYSQFLPRGRYAGDPEAGAYFRGMRYAGSMLFAVQDSQATGITPRLADRLLLQALQLASHVRADSQLGAAYRRLNQALTWQFGPGEDLTLEDLATVTESAMASPAKARKDLFARARKQGRQPRIVDAVVDRSGLEPGQTAADVTTGWRLLVSRFRADSAAFQALVYDSTGGYLGSSSGSKRAFGLTTVDGKAVKGFPLADELLALLGSEQAHRRLEAQGETAFEGYSTAFEKAGSALGAATGLEALQLELLRAWLAQPPQGAPDPLESLRAFWTLQRHSDVLYAKQSYTVTGKSLTMTKPRAGAVLEPATTVYRALSTVVAAHREYAPHESWDGFAELLARILAIDAKRSGELDADDEAFLNNIDRSLLALTDAPDLPVVVDVHTNAASREVLQEATGRPIVVEARRAQGNPVARGARLSHHEFKQPLDSRLTDEAWRRRLEEGT